MESIKRSGKVDKIVWSGDNGYKIIAVNFVGSFELEKIVGYMNVIVGQSYTFIGEEVEHPKYGKQFKVTSYEMDDVKSGEEIIDFLSSNHFKGIGKRTASKIYNHFGEETLNVLKSEPHRLEEIAVSSEIIEEIESKLVGLDGIDELFKMLKPLNFTDYLITDIYQYLNVKGIKDLVKYLKYNSYSLINNVKLMTFEKADKIFLKYNQDGYESIERYKAAFMYFSKDLCYRHGDTIIKKEEVFESLKKQISIDDAAFNQVLEELIYEKELIQIDNETIASSEFYHSEEGIARNIKLRQNFTNKGLDKTLIKSEIIKLEEEFKINYSDVQKEAIENALTNNFSIITGGPGTGKTTIIKAIVSIFENLKYPNEKIEVLLSKIMLCAPTGRAAQRMKEATGYNAKTIHSLLEWDPHLNKFNRGIDDQLVQELIIIDEFSMVDIFLANSLFKAIRPDAIVLVVGDPAQLESVAPGNVLGDLVSSSTISTVKLDLVFRQGDGSKIAKLANSIDKNLDLELINTHDMSIIDRNDNLKGLVKLVVEKSYCAGYDEIETQVLYPKYAGHAGIDALNEVLKPEITGEHFKTDERTFQVGDKVMQLKNNYDKSIYNGDIGFVSKIINKSAKGNQNAIVVNFKGHSVELTKNDLYELTHAYAISIHKSQGSEFKVVVLPVDKGSEHMLTKKLLYTAITRAKDKLIIIGDIKCFYKGIEQMDIPRKTYLKDLLSLNNPKVSKDDEESSTTISPYDFL